MKSGVLSVLVLLLGSLTSGDLAYASAGEGKVVVGTYDEFANVSVTGKAAEVLYKTMFEASELFEVFNDVRATTRKGERMECTHFETFRFVLLRNEYVCRFAVTTTGEVLPGEIRD